jgi:hypothetical protein
MSKCKVTSSRTTLVDRTSEVRRRRARSCPRLERLEGRALMSTFQVNSTLDSVAADLRTGKDGTAGMGWRHKKRLLAAYTPTVGVLVIPWAPGTYQEPGNVPIATDPPPPSCGWVLLERAPVPCQFRSRLTDRGW